MKKNSTQQNSRQEAMRQEADQAACLSATERFFKRFHVSRILAECGAYKQKGVPVIVIMMYMFNLMFSNMSMYRQMATGSFKEGFSKNSAYRFLESRRINWQRLVLRLSAAVIRHVGKLTENTGGRHALVIDDTPLPRRGGRTELVSKYFNHVNMKMEYGCRVLTLAWTDGVTTLPLLYTILASSDDGLVKGEIRKEDGRTLAGRIRKTARSKGTDLAVSFVKEAIGAGISAGVVLFDSWFAVPQVFSQLKKAGQTAVARLKGNSKQCYEFEGKMMNIKELYASCRKRRGKAAWKPGVQANVLVKKNQRILERIPVKLVFLANRAKRNDWICLLPADPGMDEREIIRLYAKRWNIEVMSKCCKTYLKFGKDFHSTSFEGQNAQLAIAFARFIMVSLGQRESEGSRSFGEMFFMCCQELEGISFARAILIIMDLFKEGMQPVLSIPGESIAKVEAYVIGRLPGYLSRALAFANQIQIMAA